MSNVLIVSLDNTLLTPYIRLLMLYLYHICFEKNRFPSEIRWFCNSQGIGIHFVFGGQYRIFSNWPLSKKPPSYDYELFFKTPSNKLLLLTCSSLLSEPPWALYRFNEVNVQEGCRGFMILDKDIV